MDGLRWNATKKAPLTPDEIREKLRIDELNQYNEELRNKIGGDAAIPTAPEVEFPFSEEQADEMAKDKMAEKAISNFTLQGVMDKFNASKQLDNQPVQEISPIKELEQSKAKEEIKPTVSDKTDISKPLSPLEQYQMALEQAKGADLKGNLWEMALKGLGLVGAANIQRSAGVQAGVKQPDFKYSTAAADQIRKDYERDLKNKLEMLKALKPSGKVQQPKISKVTESFEKELGKELPNWSTARQNAISNIQKVENAIDMLENKSDPLTSGPLAGRLPTLRTSTKDIETSIQGSVVDTLRSILGAQFTEQEGERIKALAYDPTLEPEQNIPRAKRILEELKTRLQSKDDMVNFYNEFGTLQGYDVNIPKPSQNPYRPSEGPQGDIVERNGKMYKWNPSRGKYQLISK